VIFAGANTYTGSTILSAGTLALDYNYTSQNNSKLSDSAALVLSSGTLDLRGGSHRETVASTTLTAGKPSGVTSSVAGSVLQMNNITQNVGATVNFGAGGIASTSTGNTNDILGPWATVGNANWATNSGTDDGGGVGNSLITTYTGYTDIDARAGGADPNIVDGSGTNVRIQNAGSSGPVGLSAADTTVNTLLQNTTTACTVDTAGGTLRTRGIMIGSGKEALTIGTGATPGALTAATDGGELFLINFNTAKTLTVNAVIANNSALACPLTKAGTGTLVLTGANTHTGLTTVNAGVLKLGAAGDGTNSPLGTTAAGTSVTSGAALDLAGFTLSTAEALTLNGTGVSSGGALTNSGAAAAYSGPITLGSASSIVANGDIVLSNTGTITGSGFGLTLGGTGSGSIPGVIGTGAGTLTKSGSGTWTLYGANTYTGATTISAGTLRSGANDVLPNGSAITVSGTGAGVTATLDLNGYNDTTGALTFGGSTSTSGSLITTGEGTLTLNGNVTYANASNPLGATISGKLNLGAAARTFTINDSSNAASDLTVSAVVSGAVGLAKAGTGTMTLSAANDYTGATTLTAGALSVGADNNLGNANPLIFNGGTLRVTGTALTSYVAGVIGSHAVTQNPNVLIGLDIADASNTFTVGEALIQGTGGLTKLGAGKLILLGDNTYTGATTISAGKLYVNGTHTSSLISTYSVTGTLGGGGTITTVGGAVTVNNNGKLAPGTETAPGTLTLSLGNAALSLDAAKANNAGQFTFRLGAVSDKIVLDADTFLALGTASATNSSLDWSDFTFIPGTGLVDGVYTLIDASTNATGELSTGAGLLSGSIGGGAGTLSIADGQDLILTVTGFALPGDTNGDKVVDAADYVTLKKNFGAGPGAAGKETIGDFNGDGNVNYADLQTLMGAMGTGSSGGAPATTPEPATLGLLAIGALAMLRRNRRS
jgi:autotransporter-associated beta strand protein